MNVSKLQIAVLIAVTLANQVSTELRTAENLTPGTWPEAGRFSGCTRKEVNFRLRSA